MSAQQPEGLTPRPMFAQQPEGLPSCQCLLSNQRDYLPTNICSATTETVTILLGHLPSLPLLTSERDHLPYLYPFISEKDHLSCPYLLTNQMGSSPLLIFVHQTTGSPIFLTSVHQTVVTWLYQHGNGNTTVQILINSLSKAAQH